MSNNSLTLLSQQAQYQTMWESMDLPRIERAQFDDWDLFTTQLIEPATMVSQVLPEDASVSVLVHTSDNGEVGVHLSKESTEAGIVVCSLEEAEKNPEIPFANEFGSVIPVGNDKVTAYNFANLTHGIYIYIPDKVQLAKPLEIRTEISNGQTMNQRVLLHVGQQAEIDIIDRLTGQASEASSLTYVSEVIVGPAAQIHYNGLDGLGPKTTAYVKRHANVKRDGLIEWAIGTFNDGDVILDLDSYLIGQGSHAEVAIVGISTDQQKQIVDSKVVNIAPHSIGNILQHGVILDQGRLSFNGIGLIERGAKHADSQQESRILMLTEDARGDANPILLIEEYEVTAGHAASVGQVDKEQMYYLMSRGLQQRVAEYLVVRGFLGPVMISMPSQEVREQCIDLIDAKLSRNFDIEQEIGHDND